MNTPPMKTSSLSAALSCNKISTGKVLLAVICISLSTMMMVHQVCAMQLGEQSDSIRSSSSSPSATVALIENPEFTVRVLENLLRSILYSTSPAELQPITNGAQKRGLDLGISRGFSGSQAGKHLMGLSAASFANGPGR